MKRLKVQQTSFGQFLLLNLLNGEAYEQTMEKLRIVNIHLDLPYFRVLVFQEDEHTFEIEECLAYQIQNDAAYRRYAVPLRSLRGMALIENAQTEEELQSNTRLNALKNTLEEYGHSTNISIGCVCDAVSDIPISFVMAIEQMNTPQIAWQTDALRIENGLQHFAEYLRNGHLQPCYSWLKKMFSEKFLCNEKRYNYLRARVISELWKHAEECNIPSEEIAAIQSIYDTPEMFLQSVNVLLQRIEQFEANQTHSIEELVMQYIEHHYCDSQFNMNLVVQSCRVHEKHVRRIVMEQTGMSFIDYIKNLKIEKAKKLLREENMSVSEICQNTGYSTPSYFIQLFKKITGYTPKQYQELVSGHFDITE